MRASVMVFEVYDFVLYSELLPLEISDGVDIGERTADFLIDGLLQAAMTGPKRLDTILQRHGSSYPDTEGCWHPNANADWSGSPSEICFPRGPGCRIARWVTP